MKMYMQTFMLIFFQTSKWASYVLKKWFWGEIIGKKKQKKHKTTINSVPDAGHKAYNFCLPHLFLTESRSAVAFTDSNLLSEGRCCPSLHMQQLSRSAQYFTMWIVDGCEQPVSVQFDLITKDAEFNN